MVLFWLKEICIKTDLKILLKLITGASEGKSKFIESSAELSMDHVKYDDNDLSIWTTHQMTYRDQGVKITPFIDNFIQIDVFFCTNS